MNRDRTLRVTLFVLLALAIAASAPAQERLLILAPDAFLDELWPLADFKNLTGRQTTLLGLDAVLDGFAGADDAERVKRCIEEHHRLAGVNYVMLVGDVELFPVRWRWWGLPGQEGWAATDLYYADLYDGGTATFNDWDANDNGLYGEIEFTPDGTINNDRIDVLPDVAVGRIPASTGAEVTAYVNKVIGYEIATTPGAAWFTRAALYTGVWPSIANREMDIIGDRLSAAGFTLVKRYSDWIEPTNPQPPPGVPGVVHGDFNAGVGFVSYIGHGNTACLACIGVCSSGLTNLHNDAVLPVVFATACDTGGLAWLPRLGPYVDADGAEHCGTSNGENLPAGSYPHAALPRPACVQDDGDDGLVACPGGALCSSCSLDPDCFAETILFGNPVGSGGAIAYLGERSGGQLTAIDLNRYFFEAWGKGRTILGDMWNYSLGEYYTKFNIGQSSSWQRTPEQWADGHTFDEPQKFLLFGDPSLHVGGAFASGACGLLYDGYNAPIPPSARLRIVCDVLVPDGHTLTVSTGAALLFESGRKLTAAGRDGFGLHVDGSASRPAVLLSTDTSGTPTRQLRGMAVHGQLRMHDGGQLKVH